jgi:hypothetical protein
MEETIYVQKYPIIQGFSFFLRFGSGQMASFKLFLNNEARFYKPTFFKVGLLRTQQWVGTFHYIFTLLIQMKGA